MIIGLTGGIAAGKSTVREDLASRMEARMFDADACVHRLLTEDRHVASQIADSLGANMLGPEGFPDRTALRDLVFAKTEARRALEAILHPLVRAEWTSLRKSCLRTGEHLLADIPLLYETRAEEFFDYVIVVACALHTQMDRLSSRGIPACTAKSMLASQMPIMQKVEKASFSIWNDGCMAALVRQTRLLADQIFHQ